MSWIARELPSPTRRKPVPGVVTAGLRLFSVVALVAVFLFAAPAQPRAEAGGSNAWFAVVVDADLVLGDDWLPGANITIKVDDPSNGAGFDYTFSDIADGAGWFYINVGATVDIERDFVVQVTDGYVTKDHTVTHIGDVMIDILHDQVEGTATPGARVMSWIHADTTTLITETTAAGVWYQDYSGIRDITGGTGMGFRELDDDGDGTQIDVFAPVDTDGDQIIDDIDNCPLTKNVTQYDGDLDGKGARCDDVDRLWGLNRYGTSGAVSAMAFEEADTVFIALGSNFPDALVAAAAGGYKDAPVLLTRSDSLPPETIIELLRLKPSKAYIVGGAAVISSAVQQEVGTYVPTVERLAGANRYETSAEVSKEIFSSPGAVFVALGENFPDALVAAAAAGDYNSPVLLTRHDHVPQATLDEIGRISPSTIYVIGGAAAISETAAQELSGYGNVIRVAGENRYETAVAVAEQFFACGSLAFLAYGGNFPDALVAAAAAGHLHSPVLLVAHDTIPTSTYQQLDALSPMHIWLVGGTAVIGNDVVTALP
jgi:putative cell wall-binding protein